MTRKNKEGNLLKERAAAITKSLAFFSNKKKPNREQWVVTEFLSYLKIQCKSDEIQSNPNKHETPDVFFRDAQFEVKEILDSDRKRTKEYRNALTKAERAEKISELFEHYTPVDITIDKAFSIVALKVGELKNKYSVSVCETLDLLFYLNLRGTTIKGDKLPTITTQIEEQNWGSVSVVSNNCAFVISAKDSAPKFIKNATRGVFKKS